MQSIPTFFPLVGTILICPLGLKILPPARVIFPVNIPVVPDIPAVEVIAPEFIVPAKVALPLEEWSSIVSFAPDA